MAFRVDIGTLRPAVKLPNGQLRVDGCLTRTGVFEYRNDDGSTRREYRSPDEVFKADSLASFAMVAVTDNHPPVPVTSSNARQYARGAVGESVRQDGDGVVAPMVIFDGELVRKMESGKVALSCGYEVDVVNTPGVSPNGERYDAVQTNIRGNHVALVDIARAGKVARVRMDASDFATSNFDAQETIVMDELKKALENAAAEKARADAAESTAAAEKARADGLAKDLEAAQKARTDSESTFGDRVKSRVALVSTAGKVLGEVSPDLSDRAIKVAVVKKVDGDDIAETEHDAYVAGRFDAAVKRAAASNAAAASTRVTAEAPRADGAPADSELDPEQRAMRKAREDAIRESRAPLAPTSLTSEEK